MLESPLKIRTLKETLDLRRWLSRCQKAGVATVPVQISPREIPISEVCTPANLKPLSEWTSTQIQRAVREGRRAMWRWNLCAPLALKAAMSHPNLPVRLPELYGTTLAELERFPHPLERGIALFLSTARNQFFWDGNKRTGRLLMNGTLLHAGQDIITIPARNQLEFNTKMLAFYDSGDGTEMLEMLSGLQIKSRFA